MNFPHPTYSRHVLQPAYRDAQDYLFEPMLAAHEAHAIMLAECGIISGENAAAILRAVATVREGGRGALAYQPGVEDLFFRIEARIIELAGADFGGNLQLARSRNDLGHALARMAFRLMLLDLADALLTLRKATLALAFTHLDTLMPGYTHTQPAQPITFAHYLAGVLTALAKDQARLMAAYANMNESPLGAAALTGTGFPIDRARVAQLLGFDTVIASTQHCIGAGDHLTDVAAAVQSLAVGLSRVTHDLLVRATQETNALRIDDSFIQISSIMPQKRNPVVLEHLRARLSRALGYAQTVVLQCHSIPYGDTQDIEDEIMPPLVNALATMQECVELYASVMSTVTLNEAHLRRQAGLGFTTATELADSLVREVGLPFRLAHKVVATLVQAAVRDGIPSDQLTVARLQAAAQAVLGHDLAFTAEQFQRSIDPQHFVDIRRGLGGVAAAATAAVLEACAAQLTVDEGVFAATAARLAEADAARNMICGGANDTAR
jgi:argininosuccinate lyase